MESEDGKRSADELVRACRRTVGAGFLYAGLLSAFITILQLVVPLFLLQVHDRVLNSRSIDTLRMLVVLSLGAIVLYGVLEFVRSLAFQAIASTLIRKLNLPAIEAALHSAIDQGVGRGAEVLRDLSDIRSFITGTAFPAPLEAMWSPIFLFVMFSFHPLYGLVGTISVLVMISLSVVSDLMCRQTLKEANQANIESIAGIGASLRHAEVIDAMGMLPALIKRWRKKHSQAIALLNEGHRRSRAMHALSRSTRYGLQIIVLALGAYLVMDGSASPGSMIGGTIILGRLLAPFDNITGDWRQWIFALNAWRRIRAVLETESATRESFPTPRPSSGDLVVDRVVYIAPGIDAPILKGVSFSLSPGDVLGIAGPSAAGKSTLARLLVGITKPQSGGIYLSGHNTFLWQRASFGEVVGYLPQSVLLLDGTIRENIARMAEADPRAVIDAARAAGVHEAIGRLPLGYDTPIGEARLTLSGGQKQRIGLARALFGWPTLLVLDEPNANLDAEGEQALLSAVREAKSRGAIIIIIAHRQTVMQSVDKILILNEGRVTQFGDRTSTLSQLESRPSVAKIAAAPAAS